MLPSLEALPHPHQPVRCLGHLGRARDWYRRFRYSFGHVGKTITIDPHSPYLPGSFPRPGGQPGTPTGTSTPLPWDAMPVPLPGRPCQYGHCSLFPLGCGSWGTRRPDTPANSFSYRCMDVTLRTWAPLPRMRQPGCGCRRGTRPGPAAPPSCWSTARAAVPPVVVRVSGTRVWVGTALRRDSLDTAAHPATVVRVEFLCCHGTPAPRTMPPARRAAGTQWPEIAGHAAGTGGPQPLYLGPCQGGCAGGRCMPSGAVCVQSAGCDSWTQQ